MGVGIGWKGQYNVESWNSLIIPCFVDLTLESFKYFYKVTEQRWNKCTQVVGAKTSQITIIIAINAVICTSLVGCVLKQKWTPKSS